MSYNVFPANGTLYFKNTGILDFGEQLITASGVSLNITCGDDSGGTGAGSVYLHAGNGGAGFNGGDLKLGYGQGDAPGAIYLYNDLAASFCKINQVSGHVYITAEHHSNLNANIYLVPKGTGSVVISALSATSVTSTTGLFAFNDTNDIVRMYWSQIGVTDSGFLSDAFNDNIYFGSYNAGSATYDLVVACCPSAIDYVIITGAATTAGPTIYVGGASTNCDLNIETSGTGYINLNNNVATTYSITANNDIIAYRDLVAARDGYISGDFYVGYGYGSYSDYGCIIGNNGDIYSQGFGSFIVGGVRTMEDAIATSTSAGSKGELTYGTATYDFFYTCIDPSEWRKAQVTRSGGVAEIVEAATGVVSLDVDDFGKFFINSAQATYTLPVYNTTGFKAGDKISLYVGHNSYFRITLSGSETARFENTTTAAGGYFRSTAVGSKLTLINSGTAEWIICDLSGTWTYDA
jgi:hypothetical protein